MRIYDRALTPAEVAQMYGTTITIPTQGAYNGCFMTVSDRANNASNAVRL